jgi:mitochondrial division protein 1
MMFDARRIVTAAGEDVVKIYDKTDGRHWSCGPGVGVDDSDTTALATIEHVRIKEGYMVEGRKDGMVGVWSC